MSDEPIAMIEIALLRARLCEMLAVKAKLPSDGYFTVGMFSALDILMKSPIGHILAKLPLSDDVKSAILEHQGIQGEALSCALAVEKAEWKNFKFRGLNRRDIVDTFRDAVQWTNQVTNSL
jgi:EAL and modified HD-GYP domain-containing signal transduction protein